MQVRRLSHALGAEISGVDISKPLDDESFGEIHKAFLDNGILLFRGQALTREQHIAFSRCFGELEITPPHRVGNRDADYPELVLVTNKPKVADDPHAKAYQGEGWHSDRSFSVIPAMASLLRAVEIPKVGGDTLFSNGYRAYETLSDGMKKMLEGLHGAHIQGGAGAIDYSTPERLAETQRETRTAHPIHNVVNDFDKTELRHMERATVKGTPSGYAYEGPFE